MPRVRFLEDFDYKPAPQVTIAYKVGTERTVKRECADRAVALGKGKIVGRVKKESVDAGRG